MPPPKVVAVEGIIGAGKSTLIHEVLVPELSKLYTVRVVREPVDEWVRSGLLQRYYADKRRWAFTFQTKAFHDRISECRKTIDQPADLILMERSPLSDQIFMRNLFEEGAVDSLEMDTYVEFCDEWTRIMPFQIDAFLYLRTDLDECMRRLARRNRDGEEAIPVEYQAKLFAAHERVFNRSDANGVPCAILDCTTDFRTDLTARDGVVDWFKRLVRGGVVSHGIE